MRLCRYIIAPKSPWSTRLRSDTLYGLICWHVAEREGSAACEKLIRSFEAGEPPFLLSSALPLGFLPAPCLPPISRSTFREISRAGDDPAKLFKALQEYKKFRKNAHISEFEWRKAMSNLSAATIFASWAKESEEKAEPQEKLAFEPHVAIDRVSGTAADGALFFKRTTFFSDEFRLQIYARSDNPEWLATYLNHIGAVGFGADGNMGKGLFEAILDKDFKEDEFRLENADAMLLLSVCASTRMEGVDGWYKMEIKRGKTGPGYGNPFKRPFLMLSEGSVLRNEPGVAYVLRGINSDPRVVQILAPLSLPCRLSEESRDA